jgi:hypothetical protein
MAARFGRIVYSEQATQSLSWAPAAGRRYAKNTAVNEAPASRREMGEP